MPEPLIRFSPCPIQMIPRSTNSTPPTNRAQNMNDLLLHRAGQCPGAFYVGLARPRFVAGGGHGAHRNRYGPGYLGAAIAASMPARWLCMWPISIRSIIFRGVA